MHSPSASRARRSDASRATIAQQANWCSVRAELHPDTPMRQGLRMISPTLVLASTSRYRRELLLRLGVPFTCIAPGVDETPLPGETPLDTAIRLAAAKARA